MSIKKALDNILEGNLDEMRSNFSSALSTKAVEKLEERKIEIAQKYFGQFMEEAEQIDELSRKTLNSYIKKGKDQVDKMWNDKSGKWTKKREDDVQKVQDKRHIGATKARMRLKGSIPVKMKYGAKE
jgi:arsenate reductase-like glutaredoxin family protein